MQAELKKVIVTCDMCGKEHHFDGDFETVEIGDVFTKPSVSVARYNDHSTVAFDLCENCQNTVLGLVTGKTDWKIAKKD